MRWPLNNFWVSQGYKPSDNPGHEGVDLAAPSGTTIYAPDSGVVESVNNNAAAYFGGKYITIQGDSGYRFYLGHNSSNSVKSGQRVKVGQVIGKVGMTGRADGPHVHFEMSKGGRSHDPRKVIKEVNMYKGKTAKQWHDLYQRQRAERNSFLGKLLKIRKLFKK